LRPAELLYGEIRPMVLAIIGITAAFGALSIVAALYFSRHFIGNIEKLNGYMSAVESGDYRIRNCVSGRDEFRQLNRRLNTMVHKLARNIRSLEVESTTDALCGIANRRFLTEELQTYVDAHDHRAEDVSIVLLDVDHFKPVNDTYGHAVGDEVLRRIARIMRDTFPREAVVGRYGGEEFMVLLPGFDPDGAFDVADRFRAALEAQTWRERDLTVTISGGVAALGTEESGEEVIRRADRALYRAKMAGRNRIVRADAVATGA
ncbi:MAG: diguanylate cyclase, partial [Spirochaetota bacterium]